MNPLLVPHELFVCCFDGKNAVVEFHGILFNHVTLNRQWGGEQFITLIPASLSFVLLSWFYHFKPHETKWIIYLFNWWIDILWLNVREFKGCYKIHCLEMIRNALKLENRFSITLRATVCLGIRNKVNMDVSIRPNVPGTEIWYVRQCFWPWDRLSKEVWGDPAPKLSPGISFAF